MWYQASRSLNGLGEKKLENGQCVQKRWDNFNETTPNNFLELISQYNKVTDLIELIKEETVVVDGFLEYNTTGKLELIDLLVLSTDFVNYAVLYSCTVDKVRNATVYYGEVLSRLRNKEVIRLNNLKAKNEVFRERAPWFDTNTLVDTYHGSDCFYYG